MMPLLRFLILSLTFCLALSGNIQAQSVPRVLLSLHSDQEPVEALGFLFSSQGSIQKPDVEIRPFGKGRYRLAFVYAAREIHPDTMATAMVKFPDGSVEFVRSTPLRNEALRAPLVDLPLCEDMHTKTQAAAAEVGLLQSLVEVRTKRIQQSELVLRRDLTEAKLQRLRKLERGFGLASEPLLSLDIPIDQFVARLYRILAVAKTFETNRSATTKKDSK